jgi:hypothetical protein
MPWGTSRTAYWLRQASSLGHRYEIGADAGRVYFAVSDSTVTKVIGASTGSEPNVPYRT